MSSLNFKQITRSINNFKYTNQSPPSCLELTKKFENLLINPQEGMHSIKDIPPFSNWSTADREFYYTNCQEFVGLVIEVQKSTNAKVTFDKSVDDHRNNTNVVSCRYSKTDGNLTFNFGCI